MAGTGYSFVSCSHKSLAEGVVKPDTYPIIDLILGKQRQPVITPVLQDTLRSYLAQGGNLLVSGTNLFSDSWGNAQDRTFVEEVLKGKLASRNASKEGIVNSCASPYGYINGRYTFRTRPNPICYSIESVDGVLPADKLAHTILRYPENNIGAGIVYEGKYRTCLLGFPFEALQTPSERNRLMESILHFFSIQQQNKIQYTMKRINCFIPYGKIEATRQTVAQLAESSLVSQIYLITDDPHAKAIYPCNLIRTENIWSTKTLREIAGYASAHYTLIYTKTEELQLGMYALERFVAIADDTRSGMVYSDYYEKKEGKLNPHPVIDYQKGSLRDDFNFGSLLLYRSSTLQNAIASMDTEYTFAGLYDLRLKVSQNAPLTHINEYLYTEVENDLRKSGEKMFDYVDPKNRSVQIEMEAACTDHLKMIGGYLPPHFKPVRFDEQTFQTEASVIIPVRNRVRTIEDAIRSVLRQEASFPFNLIIIDNHSTDGTSERIQAIAATDLRIIHIQPERDDLGIGGCWNIGIHHSACGKFAIQLDSDDVYSDEHTLRKIVEAFYEQRCAMVVGTYRMTDFDMRTIPPGIIDHKEWTPENGRNNALRINGLGAPRAFYTPLLRKLNLPNTSYGEDYALGLRISREYPIGRIYDVLYLCRRWEDNSDASLDVVKMNNHNIYKDKIRTWELEARLNMERQ